MRKMKALVVDDSKVGRLTMQKKLEAFGVGVDLAESGLEALNYLERNRPDMIFMDHMMPDLDGFETTRRIKAAPATRNIPVIIISASDDEAFVRDARAVGALDAIAKPPTNEAIERILVALPQTVAATAAGEITPTAPRPTLQDVAMAQPEQASVQAMIEAGIAKAVEKLRSDWMQALTTRLKAEFEDERQRLQASMSRVEARLDQNATALANLAQAGAVVEALRQRLHDQEARLAAMETALAGMATPPEDWIEAAAERVQPRLAELGAAAERQAGSIDELRQALMHRVDELHAGYEQVRRELADRIAAVSDAVQQQVATTHSALAASVQRLETLEQGLAALETGAADTGVHQAAVLASVEPALSTRLSDMLAERTAALTAELDPLREQLQALGQSQEALDSALSDQAETLGMQMEERFARMQAQIDAALQSALAGLASEQETTSKEVQAESPIATAEPVLAAVETDTPPAAAVDQDTAARIARRISEECNGRWQAEVQRLQATVKTLTLATAVGGVALLAGLIILAL
ncbi:MAG: response regulator [Thiobacillaceae bacterium]